MGRWASLTPGPWMPPTPTRSSAEPRAAADGGRVLVADSSLSLSAAAAAELCVMPLVGARVDALMNQRWQSGIVPFDGDCLVTDDVITVEELRELLAAIVPELERRCA